MRDYKKLDIWKKSHHLTLVVYKDILPVMPREEQYALTSQLRRSAYSVPMNISERCGKNTDKDFAHYLDNALGSVHELEYALLLIHELCYISSDAYERINLLINEVKAMLIGFIRFLRNPC